MFLKGHPTLIPKVMDAYKWVVASRGLGGCFGTSYDIGIHVMVFSLRSLFDELIVTKI